MILNSNLLEVIGWTLIHSIWQISLIGILVRISLFIFKNKSSRLRYNIALLGIVAIVISTVVTFNNYSTTNKIISKSEDQASIFSSLPVSYSETTAFHIDSEVPLIQQILLFIQSNISIIVYLWLIGVLIFSIRFAGSYWYIQRLKFKHSKPLNEKWIIKFKTIGKRLNLRRNVQFLESQLTNIPITIGFLKPAVILPLGLLTNLPFNQIEAIITHELAHIKRSDYIINLLISMLESIFFYHPMFWWLTKTINTERENCCDDITIHCCGTEHHLKQALLDIFKTNQKSIHIAAALYKNEFQLLKRIKRMKTKNQINHGKKGNLAGFALLLTGILIFTLSSAFGPRIADLPVQYYEDQGESNISGLLPDYAKEASTDEVPEIKSVHAEIQPKYRHPDSTKTKEFDKQMSIRSKDGNSNVVMEFDDDMNLLSVKENGEELEGEKRKEYEKKAQKMKTGLEKAKELDKKEDELKIIQKELENKQKEMQKAQQAYITASSEYYEKLHEMEGNNYFHFDDSSFNNTWSLAQNQFDWQLAELEHLKDELNDFQWDLNWSEHLTEPSDFEFLEHEKLVDLHHDQWVEYEDVFDKIENIQELEREELLSQLEDLEQIEQLKLHKIEEIEMKKFDEFENKIYKELVKDNIIKNKKDFQSFRLSSKELIVNGNKQSKELKSKYLKLYEDITEDKLKGTMQIIFED